MGSVKYDVFVCTKPFQWINVENIEKDNTHNVLIIIDNFPNVHEIAKRIKIAYPYWESILIVKNRLQAFVRASSFKIRNIYVDSDYGRKSYLYSFLKANLFVYDEGIGTYSLSLKEMPGIKNKLKYFIFKLIGASTFQGGGRNTKGVILYNILYYRNKYSKELTAKTLLPFSLPLESFIKQNISKLLRVFQFNQYAELRGQRVLIYLTFHFLRDDILTYLEENSKNYDLVIVKPHPHLLRYGDISPLQDKGFEILNNPIMAEVLILMLSKDNYITVLHESSSACLNLTKSENIQIIDFQNKLFSKDFDKYIQSLYPVH